MQEINIAKLMGGREVLGRRVTSSLEMAELITAGLPVKVLPRLKKLLRLTEQQLAGPLGVSERTISRLLKTSERLNTNVSDRIYRFARIYALALEVFEDHENARGWLISPQVGLNNERPIDLLTTEVGTREVENLLGRMEYGVFS